MWTESTVPDLVRAPGLATAGGDGPGGVGVVDLEVADAAGEAALQALVLGLVVRVGVHPVVQVVDGVHAGLEQLLGAAEAGAHGGVHGAPLHRDPEARRRQQRVLLRVHADAQVVAGARRVLVAVGAAVAPALRAVGHVRRRAVVAGGDDVAVLHDHRAHAVAGAVRAAAHRQRDAHEVLVQVGTGAGGHRQGAQEAPR